MRSVGKLLVNIAREDPIANATDVLVYVGNFNIANTNCRHYCKLYDKTGKVSPRQRYHRKPQLLWTVNNFEEAPIRAAYFVMPRSKTQSILAFSPQIR